MIVSNSPSEGAIEQIPQNRQIALLQMATTRHLERMMEEAQETARVMANKLGEIASASRGSAHAQGLITAWSDYLTDATQRATLTLDALRKRGDIFLEHQAAGAPPVLIYDHEVIVDGADLPRPCNYMLLKIALPDWLAEQGIETFDWKRPYVIIDPRAGHGAGIGGFKPDSQVGVALKDGHPVYFVAFRPMPVEGQTLADVTHAEAAFLREVQRRHPDAPNPIVVGNCQGGWATAILAARNPDLAGPIVLNGAPMSYWSGRIGQDPMRYTGGMALGVTPALLLSDLGGGKFDGAHLVQNFEMLNPGRTWFRKYYDLYADIDDASEARFLEFEKWWGGFYLMNEAEIRWIVENLFVGNRLGANEARLETGRPIDLKAIKAPIIVFASHGDNITPPQQALNWIIDTYADEHEIEIRGQRIIYMIHEEVGHLGIFVSSSVAKKEHSQMSSTLKTIEALPPGLYEMLIRDCVGEGDDRQFTVDFARRGLDDLRHLGDGRGEEPAFAAVSRLSQNMAEHYDAVIRPLLRPLVAQPMAEASRRLHPMRMQREIFASDNPLMQAVAVHAEQVRAQRQPAAPDNPFLLAERLWADAVESGWNLWRDSRAMYFETAFLLAYANPLAVAYGVPSAGMRARKAPGELRALPEVQEALRQMERGGFAEAVIRMLVLLAEARGDVRRDRLERSSEVLTSREPFSDIAPAERARIIHEQTLIAQFEPERALDTLAVLLPEAQERRKAVELVRYIVGELDEMEPNFFQRLARMQEGFGLEPLPRPSGFARAASP
ncbi:MAG: DUF3141 domain-containing protein [Neomegalonema sp.]|nr:DUF3141 domain-containing protein [Neomegalonema sp.]